MKSRFSARRALITNISIFLLLMGLPLPVTAGEAGISDDRPFQNPAGEQALQITEPVVKTFYNTTGSDPDLYEPDNTPEKAVLLTPDQPQSHSISPAGDQDFYQFELDAPSTVQLTSYPSLGLSDETLLMTLYSCEHEAAGKITYDATEESSEGLIRADLTPGTYMVEIREKENSRIIPFYEIHLSVFPQIGPDSYEPDNKKKNAISPVSGEFQEHTVFPEDDEDWFVFSPNHDISVMLEAFGDVHAPMIALYRKDGSLMAEAFQNAEGYAFVQATLTGKSDYYAKVYSPEAQVGKYRFRLIADEIPVLPQEPDAVPDSLQPPELKPGMPQEGRITSDGEAHWFRFSLEENSDIFLKAQHLSGQVQMWLYRDEGVLAMLGYANTSDGKDISANLDSGNYRVKVAPLAPAPLPAHYILSLSMALAIPGDANNAPEQAASLGLNSPLIGHLAGSDQDWFSFSLETEASVTIRTQAEAGDMALSLYRDGEFVKEIGGSQVSENLFEISQELPDGTYFVKVSGEAGFQNNIPYTIEVVSSESDEEHLNAYEPNDKLGNATPLIFGSVLNQAIAPATDTDWFVFTLDADTRVWVEARNMGLGVNGDVALSLHYSDGRPVNIHNTPSQESGSDAVMAAVTGKGAYSLIDAFLPQGTYYVRGHRGRQREPDHCL